MLGFRVVFIATPADGPSSFEVRSSTPVLAVLAARAELARLLSREWSGLSPLSCWRLQEVSCVDRPTWSLDPRLFAALLEVR